MLYWNIDGTQIELAQIPIAVGVQTGAFFRRSVKTGGNRNLSPIPGFVIQRSSRLLEIHPAPDLRRPTVRVGGIDPNPIVVDEHISKYQRPDFFHGQTIRRYAIDQFLVFFFFPGNLLFYVSVS